MVDGFHSKDLTRPNANERQAANGESGLPAVGKKAIVLGPIPAHTGNDFFRLTPAPTVGLGHIPGASVSTIYMY